MKDCVFCKIVKNELPSWKVYEDKKYLAILDLYPNTKGMTLVIPKKHIDSYAFDMKDKEYTELMLAAKKVGKKIDKALGTHRTALVLEGLEINHVHVKLYPLHGLTHKSQKLVHPNEIYFEKCEGYVTTQHGPQAKKEELDRLAKKIRES
jgi:histidine triad (HIT) family protein